MQRQDALQHICLFGAVLGLPFGEGVLREVVGVRQVVDPGQQCAEHLAVGNDAADGNAAEADPVIATLAANEAKALPLALHPMIGERDFERAVDGLGS